MCMRSNRPHPCRRALSRSQIPALQYRVSICRPGDADLMAVDRRHLVLRFLAREGPRQLAWYIGWAGEEDHSDDDHASSHGTGRLSAAIDSSTSTPFFRTLRSIGRIGLVSIEEW